MLIMEFRQNRDCIFKATSNIVSVSYPNHGNMKSLLSLFVAIISVFTVSAQETSILFLGNSYIYSQDLPGTLYDLAATGGDTIYHESSTPGGYTLEGHSTNATSLSKIASRDWDFVVLQEQSQKPSFPPATVANDTYPYAEILVDSIKSNNECTEPVFFMTWGRRDGDQQNCQFYPPLCTFEGMNARLRQSYLEMGVDNEATVAPCAAAWYHMSVINNTFWNGLYSGDGSHPSAWGTYLNACVFYATILRKSPVGIPYYSTIGQQDAEDLQQLAEDIVMDSTSSWFIGHADPQAIADHSINGNEATFSNSSLNSVSHYWDFGDGQNANDANPLHTYSSVNTYEVMYVASSNCTSDTTDLTADITTVLSTPENEILHQVKLVQNTHGASILNRSDTDLEFTLLDVSGKLVEASNVGAGSIFSIDALPSGIYLIRLSAGKESRTLRFLMN